MKPVNTTELKVWMLRNGVSQTDVARELKNSVNLVWMTVNGTGKRNRRVIAALLGRGCPPEILGLEPKDAHQGPKEAA